MYTKTLIGIITFIIGLIISYSFTYDILTKYREDNIQLSHQLAYYESEVVKMKENGWSEELIEEYATRNCIPLLEIRYPQ